MPELAVERPGRQPLHPPLEEERRHALVLLRPVDRGEHEEVVGEVGQADPDLLAVEAVGAAVAPGRRREVAGVGPDAGLGQAERRELLAAGLGHEPALALLLGPPLEQRERVQPDVDALDDAERGVGPLELLAQDREADVVHAGAAVALRDRRAEEALLGHLRRTARGESRPPRPTARMFGQDLGLGERAGRLLDEAVLVGEAEVDHRPNASGRDAGVRDASPRAYSALDNLYSADGRARPAVADLAARGRATSRRSSAATSSGAGSHGEGHRLYDTAGRAYLDFANGIAVTALGHHHPRVTAAIHAQADKLIGPTGRDRLRRAGRDAGDDAGGDAARPDRHASCS